MNAFPNTYREEKDDAQEPRSSQAPGMELSAEASKDVLTSLGVIHKQVAADAPVTDEQMHDVRVAARTACASVTETDEMRKNVSIFEEIRQGNIRHFSGLTVLPADIASLIVNHKDVPSLNFSKLKSLTPSAANILVARNVFLNFDSLEQITDETASIFGRHREMLSLPKVTRLTKTHAALMKQHKGDLILDNVDTEDPDILSELCQVQGALSLGLPSLVSVKSASVLARHRGLLLLHRVNSVSDEAVQTRIEKYRENHMPKNIPS